MIDILNSRISPLIKSATKSERILIEYIQGCDPNELIYQSITELSDITGIGEATILRFCRKLGFKGYQEFKLVIAQNMTKQNGLSGQDGYATPIAQNVVSAIEYALEIIDYDQIGKAIKLILGSKNIFFFGSGNSGLAAEEAQNRLLRVGVHSRAVCDPHFQSMIAATLSKDDVIIFVSVSGSTKDLMEVIKTAKENGVKTIVITNYVKSPISRYADVVLFSVRKEGPYDGGSLITKMTQLFVIDVLCTGIYKAMGESAKSMIEKTSISVLNMKF